MPAIYVARSRYAAHEEQGLSPMPPKSPNEHGPAAPEHDNEPETAQAPSPSPPTRQLFSVPAPIKRIFDRFPIVTYQPNDLPVNPSCGSAERNRLFVFTDAAGARRGAPSFNPQCLRWQVSILEKLRLPSTNDLRFFQAYLKFVGIDFDIVPSNNHASPTGALPYLIPTFPAGTAAIPSNKLQKWAIEEVHCEEEQQISVRFDVYASLLDHRIRNAWVCRAMRNWIRARLADGNIAVSAVPE
jgi:metaxin